MKIFCLCCGASENIFIKYSAKAHFYNSHTKFDYYFCQNCQFLWINNKKELQFNQYDNAYYSFRFKNKIIDKFRRIASAIIFNLGYYFDINLFLGQDYILYKIIRMIRISKNSSILDVGCGAGNFIEKMRYFGYKDITGIDPYLTGNFNAKLNLHKMYIQDVSKKYDLINAHHVIEHTDNPYLFLSEVHRCLNINGRAIITFPAYGELIEATGEYSYLIQAPDHRVLMSHSSFLIFCKRAKLKILYFEVDNTGIFEWLAISRLWQLGINVSSYKESYLSNFSPAEICELKTQAKDLSYRGCGANYLYIVCRL